MKRKVVAMLLALTVMSTIVACGGKKEEAAAPANTERQTSQEQEVEKEPVEEEPEETAFEDDISTWSAYEGVLDDGGVVFYCYNGDATRGAFIYLSEDGTKSVTIMGDYGYDEEEGLEYITDDETGIVLADRTVDNGDGTYTVDLGAQGTATIIESDPQKVLDTMDRIQAGTEDVTADFVARVEEANAGGGEATIDVSNWTCYAGGMEDGSTVYYAFNEDGSRGAFVTLSADETQSISIMGDSSMDEDGTLYITDDNSGLTFACVVSETDDGGFMLDYGEAMGQMLVYSVDAEDLVTTMDVIQAGTEDITEDFISLITGAIAEGEAVVEGTDDVDVSNWSCYAGGMDDGSGVFYAFNEDGSRAAFIILSADETQSITIMGDSQTDENGTIYITDDDSGITFACVITESEDGGFILDYGNLGMAGVYEADPEELINIMNYIQSNTEDITADFMSSLE